MEKDFSVSSMIMYEDESVDVHYKNGSRLQLSPCGSEFMLEKVPEPRVHPLQRGERVRQRSRFSVSDHKGLVMEALAFRNKYASRPYLPEELIPPDHIKPFFSIDVSVQWPELSSCEPELGSERETIIRSEDGRAVLKLSPSGEEFSVELMCGLSKTQSQPYSDVNHDIHLVCNTTRDQLKPVQQDVLKRRIKSTSSRSCSPQDFRTSQEKPEQMYQSTIVAQHHSCSAAPSMWIYPLSLARHHWKANFSKDIEAEEMSSPSQVDMLGTSVEGRRSRLPQALSLTCPSPHWHRWKVKDPLAKKEDSDLPTELIKIMWCQGVIYRILKGAVTVIEISPGDGSVIRSKDVLNSYFTHYRPELQPQKVKEVTYFVSSLPPDVPGQTSISSIVSRASRILACYNQAKLLLKFPAKPNCLQDLKENKLQFRSMQLDKKGFNVACAEQDMSETFTAECWSDLVTAELEKIKRFNFLMDNTPLLSNKKACEAVEDQNDDATNEPVDETCIAEALQRTSEAIKDIDALISAATLT